MKKHFSLFLTVLALLAFTSCSSTQTLRVIVEDVHGNVLSETTEAELPADYTVDFTLRTRGEEKPAEIVEVEVDRFSKEEDIMKAAEGMKEAPDYTFTADVIEKDAEETKIIVPGMRIMYEGKNDWNADIYKIYPAPSRGYALSAYLVVPEEVALGHLVIHPYKTGRDGLPIGGKDTWVRMELYGQQGNGFHTELDKRTGCVALYPVIPEESSQFRHLELDPETLLSDDEYRHLDRQVVSLADDALSYLREDKGITLSDKFDIVGYSGEGNFGVRFALLQPERLNAVCAGGVSWSPSIGSDKIDGKNAPYPLGTKGMKKFTAEEFDRAAWKDIRFFIDMGLLDDRGSYNEPLFRKMNWPWGRDFRSIWETFSDAFVSLTDNAQMVTYINLGHEPSTGDWANFLIANDNDGEEMAALDTYAEADILTSFERWHSEGAIDDYYYRAKTEMCPACDSQTFKSNHGTYYCSSCNAWLDQYEAMHRAAGVYCSEVEVPGLGTCTAYVPDDYWEQDYRKLESGTKGMLARGIWGNNNDGIMTEFGEYTFAIVTIGPDWIDMKITGGGLDEVIRFTSILD